MSRPAPDDPVARFLARRIEAGWMPGACWWIESDGRVVSRGALGSATLEPRPLPLEESTPFDLASLTKPLATALLLALFESEGRIDPSTPAGDLVQELRGSAFADRSLLRLGRHAAGLAAWRPLYLQADDLRDYLRAIAREQPAVEPGRALYSDLGYLALGAALERAAGAELDRLFRDRIAVPLGLRRCGFARGGRGFADAAATERGNAYERVLTGEAGTGHGWRARLLRGEVHDANAHGLDGVAGHAGLFGTAEEVATIARELLRPTRLPLSRPAAARLLEPDARGRTLGLVAASHDRAARGILPDAAPGHTGFTGTSLWLDPSAGRIFVLLTHRVHPRVAARSFQWLRRGFHRVAQGACRPR